MKIRVTTYKDNRTANYDGKGSKARYAVAHFDDRPTAERYALDQVESHGATYAHVETVQA